MLIGLGGTIGLAWIAWRTPAEARIPYLNAGLWTLLGALIGGRILFVLLNWSYFQLHLSEIPMFFMGGFSWVGAIIGGFISLALVALFSEHRFGHLSDAVLPMLGTLTVSAWLACWLDGCAYGRSTTAWWGLMAKDEWGLVSTRMPTQMLAALGSAVWTLFLISGPIVLRSPGTAASLGVFGYALIALLISFLRGDPSRLWYGLRFDAWGSIALISISGVAFLLAFLKGKQRPQIPVSPLPPD